MDYGNPSGHSFLSVVFILGFGFLMVKLKVYKYTVLNITISIFLCIILLGIALYTSLSRMWLGVHFLD